jgi:predicted DNA-binding protein
MGKRAGRGRPKEMENPKGMTVLVAGEVMDRLDRIADKIGISRTQLVRNIVESGLEEVEALDALGLFAVMKWTEAMKERLRERLSQVDSQVVSPA